MPEHSLIQTRYDALRERLASACATAGRDPGEVALLAVSKTRGADEVAALHALGQRAFGENYVDEACAKQAALAALEPAPAWHFIGPIQSNKTRRIAERFDWVHSIDRAKIARRLADQRPSERGPLNVLIQVNVDAEAQKAGCRPDELDALADRVAGHDALVLRGLMAIPAPRDDAEAMRPAFACLRECFEALARHHPRLDTLSMGMSDDLEAAIAEGATLVRVGTALFGPRPPRPAADGAVESTS
ncbi:YggS family pyridoxal phosphate-dependent enzyme [Wenzhouxiangella sp. XN79A]|uniref:YggS family pyridoxal phosphate-dependent enzyme n=1 Tax=Wenzhouxiangella sp. XN79A TaxID=2724193 RepID=UPI00144AF6CD|nr:YggS family pyridoxal phosphate-dependent enzyme [Wenzhouxiangella sp. XN79A]NKI35032.1 YggS family pyridoxal phosphate-dependent enzyme [Wenzhouxiangella sp. XN79A]